MRKTIASLEEQVADLTLYREYFTCSRNGIKKSAQGHGFKLEAYGIERASGGVVVIGGYNLQWFEGYRGRLQRLAAETVLPAEQRWALDTLNRWAAETFPGERPAPATERCEGCGKLAVLHYADNGAPADPESGPSADEIPSRICDACELRRAA